MKTAGVLVTCDAESDRLALEELKRMDLGQGSGEWLDTGDAVQGSILLAREGFETFSARVEAAKSIFIRHLAPISLEVDLHGAEEDLPTIAGFATELAIELDPGRTFSVQTRILGEGKLPYRKVVLNETLSKALEEATGATMDCRWPQQVVSVLCTPTKAYLGVSDVKLNRSAWPGGKHRFKREDDQVSRAEFKLLEAMSVFELDLPAKGKALDIGASPGGWSRVLAAQGLDVEAVDPADLDPRLKTNPRIKHHRKRIQEYVPSTREFSAIVNDMKMDARDSVEIMLGFAHRLSTDGVAVMTLKMPKLGRTAAEARKCIDMVHKDLSRLATAYEIVGARQLYHNRSEVTVVMKALPGI